MKRALLPALALVLLASLDAKSQEADTLTAANVYSVKALPAVKPTEETLLSGVVSPSANISAIIRRFTGVQVKDYGGVGGLKTVNVRSLGSEHTGVFIDGIQVDNAQNMQVDLGRFSADGFSTVSLYNAQKSVRLQTAKEYAAGAAIYLDTGRPVPRGGSELMVRLRTGSFATVNPSVRYDRTAGSITIRASAGFLYSSGMYKYPYFDTTLVRENGDIRSLRLETQVFGRTGKKGDWQIHLYSYGSERGFPGPVIRRASGFPFSAERQADQDMFAQGNWNQEWTDHYSTSVRFKYANSYTHYDTHPERNPMALPYNLHYRQQSGYLSLAQSCIITSPWSVDLSTDIQRNALDSDAGQFTTPRRTTLTCALATRGVWEKFRAAAHIVYLGAWDEFLSPSAGGWSREDSFRDAWMPSVSIFYSPARWLEADAFLKRSYRLPSFNDLYYSLMGNSGLVPESAFQTGADIKFSVPASGKFPGLQVRVSPYYNRVDNKIVAIPTASQFRWTMLNIGTADITGMETKADVYYALGDWDFDLLVRYIFQQALDHTEEGSQTWGGQIPYIPRHSGSIDFTASWKSLSLSWETTITGERWSRTANTPDYRIAPWSTTDVSLRYDAPDLSGLTLSLCCGNIFNHRYQIVQGYPMPGRNLLLCAEFSF